MLNKISQGIFKYKKVILLIIGILFAITTVGTVFLIISENKINSDMVSYLADDSQTKQGLMFLQSEFDIRGNATVVVRVDENNPACVNSFRTAVDNISKKESVTNVTWYGAVESYEQIDTDLSNVLSTLNENKDFLNKVIENISDSGLYNKTNELKTLLSLADYFGVDFINTENMQDYLRHETSVPGVYDYVVLVLTDIDAGDGAYALLDQIKSEFSFTDYSLTGTTETAQRLLVDTMKDLPWFIISGVLAVLVILLLCTSSFIEPFILIFTLIVGIVISMGINFLFPSISIISFAISAVLQLAITMDYAIFYMHVYRRNRVTMNLEDATTNALPEVAGNVLASGFTTIGGFAALYCMKFTIGTDIANVLIKGIALSMVTVLLLQPILTFYLDGTIQKTQHNFIGKLNDKIKAKKEAQNKKFVPLSKGIISRPIAKFSVWQRIVLIIIAIGLIVPSFIGQSKVNYSYLELYDKANNTEEEILANELGNQLILAVPLKVKKNNSTQQDFIAAIKAVNPDRITGMLGAFTAVDINENLMQTLVAVMMNEKNTSLNSLKNYLDDGTYLTTILGDDYSESDVTLMKSILDKFMNFGNNVDVDVLKSYFREVNGEWYTLYTISFNGNTEDAEAQNAYKDILSVCNSYFGENNYYPVGMITSSYEMSTITPKDFLTVTLVSLAIIYFIVMILLRNPLKSLLIVIIIELGIWINIAFNYVFGESINFIVYIIISSVQLGCTVDYAILFANTFEKNRSSYENGKKCAIATATETIPPILTSALMIASVCLSMYLISDNLIIKQLTGMLARGAAISFVLVVFVQTAVWSFFKTERKTRNFEEKLRKLEENDTKTNDVKTEKKQKIKLSAEEKLALLEKETSPREKA